MPGPLSMMRTTTRCCSRAAVTSTRPPIGNGVERVVDQVRPDLIELAGEAADAREVRRRRVTVTATDFVRAFDLRTATVLPRP